MSHTSRRYSICTGVVCRCSIVTCQGQKPGCGETLQTGAALFECCMGTWCPSHQDRTPRLLDYVELHLVKSHRGTAPLAKWRRAGASLAIRVATGFLGRCRARVSAHAGPAPEDRIVIGKSPSMVPPLLCHPFLGSRLRRRPRPVKLSGIAIASWQAGSRT